MTTPINISTLSILYTEAYQNSRQHEEAGSVRVIDLNDLSNVELYYDLLSEALRVHLMAQKLIRTGLFQVAESRTHRSFKAISSVMESTAYVIPGGAAAVHLTKEFAKLAIEIGHYGGLALIHGIHAAQEGHSLTESLDLPKNDLLEVNMEGFIQNLTLDLAIRFRHELKMVSREGIEKVVKLHREHILERIKQEGESESTPSLNKVRNLLIEEIDPDPVSFAVSQMRGYAARYQNRCFQENNSSEKRNFLTEIFRSLRAKPSVDPSAFAGELTNILSETTDVILLKRDCEDKSLRDFRPQCSLTNPALINLDVYSSDLGAYYTSFESFWLRASQNSKEYGDSGLFSSIFKKIGIESYSISFSDLMERVSLLMLRKLILIGTAEQSSEFIQKEFEKIVTFPFTPNELTLLKKIEQQETRLSQVEKRLALLDGKEKQSASSIAETRLAI